MTRNVDWKRLGIKAVEEATKKTIELSLVALLVGATFKLILIAIPAVTIGSLIAKLVKIHITT